MKRFQTGLIALTSLLAGIALSGFYYKSVAPAPGGGGFNSLKFSTLNSIVRANPGIAMSKNNQYYFNVLQYGSDSVSIVQIDSMNMSTSSTVAYNAANIYTLTTTKGMIDTIPQSVYTQTNITLFDSTIYSRNGIIYGYDKSGTLHNFPIGDVVSVTGIGGGSVVYGIVSIELYE